MKWNMKWNELPEECKTCIHLKAFNVYMGGNGDYICNKILSCGEENDWIQRKEENREMADKNNPLEELKEFLFRNIPDSDIASKIYKMIYNLPLAEEIQWHTGNPTEKGWYLVTDGKDYDVSYWFVACVEDEEEEDDEGEWDSPNLNKIIAWQKIYPYKRAQ